jgi:hypothetical protein
LAKQPGSTGRDVFRADAETAYRAAFRKGIRKRPTYQQKEACIDLCRADLVDHLATDLRTVATGGPDDGRKLKRGSNKSDVPDRWMMAIAICPDRQTTRRSYPDRSSSVRRPCSVTHEVFASQPMNHCQAPIRPIWP